LVKFEEHRLVLRRGFSNMTQNFSAKCDLVLNKTVWKYENLNCGFYSKVITLKCEQQSFKLINTSKLKFY